MKALNCAVKQGGFNGVYASKVLADFHLFQGANDEAVKAASYLIEHQTSAEELFDLNELFLLQFSSLLLNNDIAEASALLANKRWLENSSKLLAMETLSEGSNRLLYLNRLFKVNGLSQVKLNNGNSPLDSLGASRPKTKWILGANYNINKFGFSLNNTLFGKTTFQQQGLDSNIYTEFTPKVVTDLGINFNATEKFTIALNINNLLNVLPEWSFISKNSVGDALLADAAQVKNQSNLITFNQRYSQMTYDGYHFSQLGTMLNLSLNYKF